MSTTARYSPSGHLIAQESGFWFHLFHFTSFNIIICALLSSTFHRRNSSRLKFHFTLDCHAHTHGTYHQIVCPHIFLLVLMMCTLLFIFSIIGQIQVKTILNVLITHCTAQDLHLLPMIISRSSISIAICTC